MTSEIATVLAILVAAIVLFVSERLRPDLVALMVLLAITVPGLVSPEEAFASLGNPAVITVGAIFVISAALFRTGIAHSIGERIAAIAGKDQVRLTIIVMLTASLMSSFMNNVGAAAVLLPAVVGLCRQSNISPSKLLIPLSFGSLTGGMLTLIGTPSNLLVNAALHDRGLEPLGMFDMTPIGLTITVLCIGYMVLVGRRLLPTPAPSANPFGAQQANSLIETYSLGERLFRIRIPPGSRLVGRTLAQSTLRDEWNLNVLAVERHGEETLDPPPETMLLQGDVLLLEGKLHEFREKDVEPYLEILPSRDWSDADLETPEIGIAEVVVAPRSSFTGRTLRQVNFREKYDVSVVGIWRGNRPWRTGLGEIPLQVGDALLLQGAWDKLRILKGEPDLLFIDEPEATRVPLHQSKALFALGALALMLVLVIAGWLDLPTAAVLAGTLMVLAGAISMEDAQHAIELRAIFIIAAMLPLGLAMEKSGTARYLANLMVQASGRLGPTGVLASITLFAGLAVQIMSNATTAVLVTPIALNAARQLNANPQTFAIAVALAASAAYLTPIAHQAHLLVMGAGGYRFSDYSRVGIGIWFLTLVAIILLLPLFFPLYP
jgi:di/tricarboxylate transporter